MGKLEDYLRTHKDRKDYISPSDLYQIVFNKMKYDIYNSTRFTLLINVSEVGIIKCEIKDNLFYEVYLYMGLFRWRLISNEEVHRRLIITLRREKIDRLKERIK